MKKYEFFAQLAEKPAKKWTTKQKELVRAEADKRGIKINEACPDCWADAAIQLAVALKPKPTPKEAGGFALRDDIDVVLESYRYGRMHVCKEELTEENARKWLQAGIPKRFFVKLPADV